MKRTFIDLTASDSDEYDQDDDDIIPPNLLILLNKIIIRNLSNKYGELMQILINNQDYPIKEDFNDEDVEWDIL